MTVRLDLTRLRFTLEDAAYDIILEMFGVLLREMGIYEYTLAQTEEGFLLSFDIPLDQALLNDDYGHMLVARKKIKKLYKEINDRRKLAEKIRQVRREFREARKELASKYRAELASRLNSLVESGELTGNFVISNTISMSSGKFTFKVQAV